MTYQRLGLFITGWLENGQPGMFRVELDGPAPSHPGAQGLEISYTIASNGNHIQNNLQGSVWIAPGSKISDGFVVPIDDFIADANDSISINLEQSSEGLFAVDPASSNINIDIVNNDNAGIAIIKSGQRLFVSEQTQASDQTASLYAIRLLSQPVNHAASETNSGPGQVTINLNASSKFIDGSGQQVDDIGNDQSGLTFRDGSQAGNFEETISLTFDDNNWFIPQVVLVNATHDNLIEDGYDFDGDGTFETTFVEGISVEPGNATASARRNNGIHQSEISYTVSSNDDNYTNELLKNYTTGVNIIDFELPDTTGESINSALASIAESMDDISFPIVGTLEGKTGNTFRSFITSVTNNISSTTLLTTEAIRQSIQSAIKSVFPSSREDVVDLATNSLTMNRLLNSVGNSQTQ